MYICTVQSGPGRVYQDGSLGALRLSGDFLVGALLGVATVWVIRGGATLPQVG